MATRLNQSDHSWDEQHGEDRRTERLGDSGIVARAHQDPHSTQPLVTCFPGPVNIPVARCLDAVPCLCADPTSVTRHRAVGECVAQHHSYNVVCLARALCTGISPVTRSDMFLERIIDEGTVLPASIYFPSVLQAAMATELQAAVLAHGDAHLEIRIDDALRQVRGQAPAFAILDLLWAFVTARAPADALFESAAIDIDLLTFSADGLAAFACSFAVAGRRDSTLARRVVSAALALDVRTCSPASLVRLAWAVGVLDPQSNEVDRILCVIASLPDLPLHYLPADELVLLAQVAASIMPASGAIAVFASVVDVALLRLRWPRSLHPPDDDPAAWIITPSMRIKIIGLRTRPALNGARGSTIEFLRAAGRWRVWLDGGPEVAVREVNLEQIDWGLRPTMCCDECWRLSASLYQADDNALYCGSCWYRWFQGDPGAAAHVHMAPDPSSDDRPPITDDVTSTGVVLTARVAAQLACSIALAVTRCGAVADAKQSQLLSCLCEFALWTRLSWPAVASTSPTRGAEMDAAKAAVCENNDGMLSQAPWRHDEYSIAVVVIDSGQTTGSAAAVLGQVQNENLAARRLVAIDGRHRVVRRTNVAHKDFRSCLSDFALRSDEARPVLGLALAADSERGLASLVGSWLSHTRAIRAAIDDGFPYSVVLEDGEVLCAGLGRVVRDVIACTGGAFDVVHLGPADWRLRTLKYARKRKVIQLQTPCPPWSREQGEELVDELRGVRQRRDTSEDLTHYFLYWVGAPASDPESLGSVGSGGYVASLTGLRRLSQQLTSMWESWPIALQAELQGDNLFTKGAGSRRLLAVWPPLLTPARDTASLIGATSASSSRAPDAAGATGKADLEPNSNGQVVGTTDRSNPVHLRDQTLISLLARAALRPTIMAGVGLPSPVWPADDTDALRCAAAAALALPPVSAGWMHLPSGWVQLFEMRSAEVCNELQSEMLLRLRSDTRFLGLVTFGLAWSWTVLGAMRLLGLGQPAPGPSLCEAPPTCLPAMFVDVLDATSAEMYCPEAWFRDIACVVPKLSVNLVTSDLLQPATADDLVAAHRVLLEESSRADERALDELLRPQIRVGHARLDGWLGPCGAPGIALWTNVGAPGRTLSMAQGALHSGAQPLQLRQRVRDCLRHSVPVVATAQRLEPLLEALGALEGEPDTCSQHDGGGGGCRPHVVFVGRNLFASLPVLGRGSNLDWSGGRIAPTTADGGAQAPTELLGTYARLQGNGVPPDIDGHECFLAEKMSGSQWRILLAQGKESIVQEENLALQEPILWPSWCENASLNANEVWAAVEAIRGGRPLDGRPAELCRLGSSDLGFSGPTAFYMAIAGFEEAGFPQAELRRPEVAMGPECRVGIHHVGSGSALSSRADTQEDEAVD